MNASKPNTAASTPTPGEAPSRRSRAQRSGAAQRTAVTPRPEPVEPTEVDFERHDTIPAPTWLDDGSETS